MNQTHDEPTQIKDMSSITPVQNFATLLKLNWLTVFLFLLIGIIIGFSIKTFQISSIKVDRQENEAIYFGDDGLDAPLNEQLTQAEKKLEIQERDIRLKYYKTGNVSTTLLVDYTPMSHTPEESDVVKVISLPQENIIIGWEVKSNRPRNPIKVLLSNDKRFLVIDSIDGISIYDYQQDVLFRSLEKLRPEISETNLVKIEDNKIILGLFEGRGGVCEESAYSVNLEDLTVKLLKAKEEMGKC